MMKRRFSATQQTTIRDLQRVMTQIDATSLRINQDVMGENKTVEIIFDRNGRRYIVRGERWDDSLDNLRSCTLTIMYLYRALEQWGAKVEEVAFDQIFDQVFGGFIATPDDSVLMLGDGNETWYVTLGVEPNADKRAIQNAFRALAKIHHPDAGGDAEVFKKLRRAYDQGLALATKRGGAR